MTSYFSTTVGLGSLGILLALFAWFCSSQYASDPMHTMFFGTQIPMALFGMMGYGMIALTALVVSKNWGSERLQWLFAIGNSAFVIFATIFTIYLVWKAIQVKLFCPGCIMCWGLNIYLAIRLVKFVWSLWRTQPV